ncbi:DUF7344 domain-containing protein, partial [Halorubrum lacusprofundi]
MRSVQSNTKCDPTERMLAVLADQQRRRILQHLETSFDDRVSVSRLARAVAEMSTTTKTGDKVERAAIRLRHVHLPKLAEAGLVDYDPNSRSVLYR